MNKKQKLRNAVILGLLMSSITASSVWAESLVVENIRDNNVNNAGVNYPVYGIKGDTGKYLWWPAEYEFNSEKVFDGITVNVKNNYYEMGRDSGDLAIGITSVANDGYDVTEVTQIKSNVLLNSINDISVNVQTRNALNGYGILAANDSKKVELISQKGNIYVDVSKTEGVLQWGGAANPDSVLYEKSNVYGMHTENNGLVKLDAGKNIIINSYYDTENVDKENIVEKLKQGDIYGISNTGGTVDLTAGNTISITANSANGNAYGIYTNSNKDTNLNGNVNITAIADETGKAYGIYAENGTKVNIGKDDGINVIKAQAKEDYYSAYGIKAENGSKVDITGDTYVSGDNGAIVISGKENAAVPLNGENDFLVTVDGNLTAESAEGAAIAVEKNGSLHVTGDQVINNTFEIKDNSNVVIDGSLASSNMIADNAVNVFGSSLTVGGNVWLDSEKVGMDITGSNVTIEGNGVFGTNYIGGVDAGIDVDSSSLAIKAGNTVIVSENNALMANNATVTIGNQTSENLIAADSSSAIIVKGDSNLTINGSRNVISTNSESAAAVELIEGADVTINGLENYIYGNYDENGVTHSVKANGGSTFTMGTDGGSNVLYGVVSAENKETKVTLNGSNTIYSSTHGSIEAGREHIVAALFARDNAEISLNAGETGRNVIVSDFEFQTGDEHKDDSERTIWAQQGGKITINGATDIIASNSGEYTGGQKGNARGIAITAGSEVIPESGIDKDGIIYIDDSLRSTVTLNYAGESLIKGDIVSGYGGLVNVASNSNGKLYMEGNALAANGGKMNLDLGNGGVWYGRADNYGDAGYGADAKNHSNFYNPAFSNDIIEGGTVNIKMNDGLWVLTGQSWVSELNATGSIIDMAGQYISEENKEMFDMDHTHALVVDNFKGKGSTFIMDLKSDDVANSDMLYIKNNEGTFDIKLVNALDEVALDEIGELRFATIHGQVPDFSNGISQWDRPTVMYAGSAFNDVVYEVGTEKFEENDEDNSIYNEGEDTNTKLKSIADNTEEDAGSFEHGKPGEEYINNSFADGDTNLVITGVAGRETGKIGQTIVDMSKANYTNAIYMDRLNKRMGETRFIDGDEGMWVRMRHDRIGKEDSFRSMNTMYEMGYDVKQDKDNGEHRVGFAIDYMDGSTSYSKLGGDGDISRKGIWMYDTWVGEKGHYRDFVAKWGHLSNDFDVYAVNGDNVTGDYSNNVYSISAEFGKKNDIGNNWYFEPQAQLQYAHVTGAEYMTNAGTAVNVDDINSLIARAGFRLGKDIGERSTVYFKADLMHEFLGEQDVFAMDDSTGTSGAHERYDHGGTWCDLGFGFATAISKTSYAYLDVETSLGNDYDETYQINAGLQWTF